MRRTLVVTLLAAALAIAATIGPAFGQGHGQGPPGGTGPGADRPGSPPVHVTILHDSHFHGSFGAEDGPNIARYMALVNRLKNQDPDALFLGNGDDLAPSVLASVFRGEHMIEALNASPMDVNTLGNHEFDFGPDNLRERIAESEFTWVTANVRDITTGEPFAADLGVERFVVRDVKGVSVGITGLGPEGMATVTTLGDETEQIPAIDAMSEVVPEMREAGADLVVVTSHLCGSDARELAATVDGIDVITGDHCAEVLEQPEVINDTIVSFAGDEFDHLGQLTLKVRDGEILKHRFRLHEVRANMRPDPTIQAIVDRWEGELDEALGEVIGFRTNDWDVVQVNVRSGETGIGNYIVDSMAMSVGADVAITNGGGLRSDQVYEGGEDIILRDVQAILPFGNTVVLTEVSGATILAALEHGVAAGTPQGRFPHVSGMRFVWNPGAAAGSRIVEVTVGGEPLDLDATYSLATNDFMLGGGDGYAMLADGTVIIGPEGAQPMMDAVVDRIRAEETVTVETDGRVAQQ